jgi:hypothetical protein
MDVLIEKEASAHLFGAVYRMIHYVALAYPTVPDHQQQHYKTSSRAYRKSSRVRNVAIIWPSICEKRLSLFLCPKANILSSTGPSTFTIGSTQTVENRPMIRKSLGPSTNTGTDVGYQSVYAVHVRHHRRYPMLRTVLDVLCCTQTRYSLKIDQDMDLYQLSSWTVYLLNLPNGVLICAR